jgi:hypothetical protein
LAAQRKFLKILERQRSTKEVTLVGVTARAGQKFALRIGFNTLGDDTQAQTARQCDDGSGNRGIVRVGHHVVDEGFVDLQLVQRQADQIGKGESMPWCACFGVEDAE